MRFHPPVCRVRPIQHWTASLSARLHPGHSGPATTSPARNSAGSRHALGLDSDTRKWAPGFDHFVTSPSDRHRASYDQAASASSRHQGPGAHGLMPRPRTGRSRYRSPPRTRPSRHVTPTTPRPAPALRPDPARARHPSHVPRQASSDAAPRSVANLSTSHTHGPGAVTVADAAPGPPGPTAPRPMRLGLASDPAPRLMATDSGR